MAYYSRRGPMEPMGYGFGGLVPRGVKWLLISNSILFVLYFLAQALEIVPLLFVFQALADG